MGWQTQYTVFEVQPDREILRQHLPKAGFRVLLEKHRNLFFLLPGENETSQIPNFGAEGGFARLLSVPRDSVLGDVPDFVREQSKSQTIRKGQFDKDVVLEAIQLSDVFGTRVLCAYNDDEDVDIVAVANEGVLESLQIAGTIADTEIDGEPDSFILGFLPGEVLGVKRGPIGHCDLFTDAFELTFEKSAPSPLMFGTPIPEAAELKKRAQSLGVSQAALKRAYGQFKVVDREASQIRVSKISKRFELVLRIVTLPFLLMAALAFYAWDDFNDRRSARNK